MTENSTIGTRIARARQARHLTQSDVADQLGVTFQAVSLWERDASVPDTYNLIELAKVLKVSVSSIVEDRGDYVFKTHKKIYDSEHMEHFVRHTSRAKGYRNALRALDYAKEAHEGQYRHNSTIKYIYHPLNVACHCFALGVDDDELIAACLLHDVVEDCHRSFDELPVSDGCKELVRLLTKDDSIDDKDKMTKAYYKALKGNSRAALIKCIDRCNNLTTMSWGKSREGIYKYIQETETYVLPLLKTVKDDPDLNNAAWLLQYQIESTLDIYKRLM